MRYVICINNKHYEASLEVRKVYKAFHDGSVKYNGLLKIIDETGEDYLYPAEFFVPIEIPKEVEKVFNKI